MHHRGLGAAAPGGSAGTLEEVASWSGFALLLGALGATAQHNYLLFHSLVEILRIVVVFGIAALAWNARRQVDAPFLTATAMAYPAVGLLELLHVLTYRGMGLLGADADLPTQLWMAFRGLESLAMLVAAGWPARRKVPAAGFAAACLGVATLLAWMVMSGRFPACFVEGRGLTEFKISGEYVISGGFAATLIVLWKRRGDFSADILPLVLLAIVFDIFAELAFTRYASVYGAANLLGHLLLLTSTYLIYRALLLKGVRQPQELLFRHLQRERELLARSEADLAVKVAERTAEVTDANRRLQLELIERKRIAEELAESEEMLRLTRNVALDAVIVMNDRGRILTWSPAAVRLFGYEAEEAIGCDLHRLITPERYLAAAQRGAERFGASGTGRLIGTISEMTARHRDGSEMPVEVSIAAVTIRGAWHAVGIIRDIRERKQHEARIARLVRVYQVLSGINSAIVRLHERQAMLDEACRVAAELGEFGIAWIGLLDADGATLKPAAACGIDAATIGATPIFLDAARQGVQATAGDALSARRAVYCNDLQSAPPAGPVRARAVSEGYGSVCVLPLVVDGAGIGVLELYAGEPGFFDADEMKLLDELAADISFALQYIDREERLNYLAYYDALTALPNRQLFLDRLNQVVLRARADNAGVAVILLDLDDFTRINEVQGRGVGDAVLKAIADRLLSVVNEPSGLARVGADTFAVAVSGLQHGIDATAMQARIFEALDHPLVVGGTALQVGSHCGIALYPGDGDNAETLLQNAETALREARASATRSLFYAPEINIRRAADEALERALRTALETGQLVAHYQPRVDLASGEIAGAEALIRWQHPERGLVPPGEFIPLAERTGLIVPIGAWMADTVCAQQAAWRAAGIRLVPVAINLSPLQFSHDGLLATLEAPLAKHGIDAKHIELELTEGLVMRDPDAAVGIMRRLRASGFHLALDDFGTGYSSLAYLSRFPFDFVKIDRAFVRDITSNPGNAAIATAVIAMAHRLKLSVIAEGVESEGQLQYLRRHHCDQVQGFHFSPAVPADAFAQMLAGAKRLNVDGGATVARQQTLLLVDDEASTREALCRTLRREGYRILTAATPEEGLDALAINLVQVVISAQHLRGMAGTEFLGVARELYPETVRIILSGDTDLQVVIDAVNRGAVHKFLTKPWDDDLLKEHVRDAFRRYRPTTGLSVALADSAELVE